MKYLPAVLILCAVILTPAVAQQSSGWQENDYCRIKGATGAQYEIDGENLKLLGGDVLVEVIQPLKIAAPRLKMDAKKSLLLFKLDESSERCLVLWDDSARAVKAESQKRSIHLGAGDEIIASDTEPRYTDISRVYDVGRRRIQVHQVGPKNYLTKTEFSLVHVLDNVPLVHELSVSTDPHDRAWKERLMKTAAVLGVVTNKHGSYARRGGY